MDNLKRIPISLLERPFAHTGQVVKGEKNKTYISFNKNLLKDIEECEEGTMVVVVNSRIFKRKSVSSIMEINFSPETRRQLGENLARAIDKKTKWGDKEKYKAKMAKNIGLSKRSLEYKLDGSSPITGEEIVAMEQEGIHRDEILGDLGSEPGVLRRIQTMMNQNEDINDDLELVLKQVVGVIDKQENDPNKILQVCDRIKELIQQEYS